MRRDQLFYRHVCVSHVGWRAPHERGGARSLLETRLLPGGRTGTAAWRTLALHRRRPVRHRAVRRAGHRHGTAVGVNPRLCPPPHPSVADMGRRARPTCR
jgi:hypothetical protein